MYDRSCVLMCFWKMTKYIALNTLTLKVICPSWHRTIRKIVKFMESNFFAGHDRRVVDYFSIFVHE